MPEGSFSLRGRVMLWMYLRIVGYRDIVVSEGICDWSGLLILYITLYIFVVLWGPLFCTYNGPILVYLDVFLMCVM